MNISLPNYRKIGLVYGILVILVLVAVGVRLWSGRKLENTANTTQTNQTNNTGKAVPTAAKPKPPGKISLESSASSVKAGESIDVAIFLEAPGKKLDGADVILRFDPDILSAVGFSEGTIFKLYPRKDIDNQLGVVKVTGLDMTSDAPLSKEKIIFGKVQFTGVKAGSAQISFDFTSGSTSVTTMTESLTSNNLLGEAKGMTVKVKE